MTPTVYEVSTIAMLQRLIQIQKKMVMKANFMYRRDSDAACFESSRTANTARDGMKKAPPAHVARQHDALYEDITEDDDESPHVVLANIGTTTKTNTIIVLIF